MPPAGMDGAGGAGRAVNEWELRGLLILLHWSAFLMIILAVPLIQGQVPPNGVYGFRLPKLFSSEELWYAANRYAGKELFRAGWLTHAGLLPLWFVGDRLSEQVVSVWIPAAQLLPVAIAVIRSLIYARRL